MSFRVSDLGGGRDFPIKPTRVLPAREIGAKSPADAIPHFDQAVVVDSGVVTPQHQQDSHWSDWEAVLQSLVNQGTGTTIVDAHKSLVDADDPVALAEFETAVLARLRHQNPIAAAPHTDHNPLPKSLHLHDAKLARFEFGQPLVPPPKLPVRPVGVNLPPPPTTLNWRDTFKPLHPKSNPDVLRPGVVGARAQIAAALDHVDVVARHYGLDRPVITKGEVQRLADDVNLSSLHVKDGKIADTPPLDAKGKPMSQWDWLSQLLVNGGSSDFSALRAAVATYGAGAKDAFARTIINRLRSEQTSAEKAPRTAQAPPDDGGVELGLSSGPPAEPTFSKGEGSPSITLNELRRKVPDMSGMSFDELNKAYLWIGGKPSPNDDAHWANPDVPAAWRDTRRQIYDTYGQEAGREFDTMVRNQLNARWDAGLPFTKHVFDDRNLYGPEGPQLKDIKQGSIGSCFFLATMGAYAHANPDVIKQAITYDPQTRSFNVTLYKGEPYGKDPPVKVVVSVTQADLLNNLERHGGSRIDDGEADAPSWPAVLETAYAKLHDSDPSDGLDEGYDAVDSGGFANEAIYAMTGQSAFAQLNLNLTDEGVPERINRALANGFPVTVYTDEDGWEGLIGTHWFTVTGTHVDENGEVWIDMRNPWGSNSAGEGPSFTGRDNIKPGPDGNFSIKLSAFEGTQDFVTLPKES